MKKNVSLIGMPAVGKSTVGVLLAKKLGYGFMDTDIVIQTEEDQTLAEIIAEKELDAFLEIEKRHVVNVDCDQHVIATGGSVIYKEEAMARLAEISQVIYLAIDLDVLMTRLSDVTARGVAIGQGKGMGDLHAERTPLYEKYCDIKVDCGTLKPAEVVAAVMAKLS